MRVFCPQIQGICEDGYPGDEQCVLWDAENKVCTFAENMKYAAEAFKQQASIHLSLKPRVPQDDEKLGKMLEDVNLDEEGS